MSETHIDHNIFTKEGVFSLLEIVMQEKTGPLVMVALSLIVNAILVGVAELIGTGFGIFSLKDIITFNFYIANLLYIISAAVNIFLLGIAMSYPDGDVHKQKGFLCYVGVSILGYAPINFLLTLLMAEIGIIYYSVAIFILFKDKSSSFILHWSEKLEQSLKN